MKITTLALSITAFFVTSLLTACGGGKGGAETLSSPVVSKPAPSPTCIPREKIKVQLFGDSTQVGYDGFTRKTAVVTPAIALQGALNAEFGAGAVVVISRAVYGTTSQELLTGTDGLNLPWPGSVDADIIVINHGINDMTRYGIARLSEYSASLRTLANAPARVIFETPNITKNWDIGPYADAMRAVARTVNAPIADVYAYTSGLPDWRQQIPDWAHPSSGLYEQIGTKVLAPVVASEVRILLCK